MYGIFIIFLFYTLGTLISIAMGELIPGSVIGMVLLFISLLAGWVNPEKIRQVAIFLTGNMALFFVPVGVGLMATTHYFSGALPAIVTTIVISTLLVMVSVGWIQQLLERKK